MRSATFDATSFAFGPCKLLRRRATGIYYVTWYDARRQRTRRRSTDTQDLEAAKTRLIALVEEIQRGRRVCLPPDKVCLYTAIDYYLERQMTPDRLSYKHVRCLLPRLLRFLQDHQVDVIADLTVDLQKRYIDMRRQDGVQVGTIACDFTYLKAAVNCYRKAGFVQYVPHILSLPKRRQRERWLTPEEAKRLLDAAVDQDESLRDYILLALNTLARPQAILTLTLDQVDLVNRRIDFLKPGQTPSNKGKPVVSIADPLMPVLQRRIARSVTGRVIEKSGRPVTSIYAPFRAAVQRAGLGREVIPYTLRHTGATWLAQRGVPLRVIAGMMGHAEQRTTEIYAKHHPSFQSEAIRTLNELFSGMEGGTAAPPQALPSPQS